jgi:hypothetical protein
MDHMRVLLSHITRPAQVCQVLGFYYALLLGATNGS